MAEQNPLEDMTFQTNQATMFKIQQPTFLKIYGTQADDPLIIIDLTDGSMIFGPQYTPDKAAHVFWEAVSSEYREFLKWKAEHDQAR